MKGQELLAYHSTILMEALRLAVRVGSATIACSENIIWRRSPALTGHCYTLFYSLSFLSQRVEASTCPKCMGSDHSQSVGLITSLNRSQCAAVLQTVHGSWDWQRNDFVVRALPSRGELKPPQNRSASPTMRASVFGTQSLVTESTNASGVVAIIR